MKKATVVLLLMMGILPVFSQSVIKVNQLGYLPEFPKYAWVNDVKGEQVKWYVKNAENDETVFAGTFQSSKHMDRATGEVVNKLDFSKITQPGRYYVEVQNTGRSPLFSIAQDVYDKVWSAGVKSYYYQRSGMDLTPEYAGIWARNATHTRDAVIYLGFSNGKIIGGKHQNCVGGWYDAGDFGKKIVPAAMAMFSFLKFAELFPEKVMKARVDIPNPWKGLPDMLAEVKWELDWFFTMQEINGAVHHLIVSPDFFIGPAQNDKLPRYILPVSSTATADFAAAMAMAGKIYSKYLPSFADSCLLAAEKAWDYLEKNPDVFPAGGYRDPEGINATGAYEDPYDQDERIWAAAELFNTTGKQEYKEYFENNYHRFSFQSYGWWFDPHNYGLLTWLLAPHQEKSSRITEILTKQVRHYADSLYSLAGSTGYGVLLSPDQYIWGSNSYVLNYGMELLIINRILRTDKYTETAIHQLNYILGCNSLNLSFVCGHGTNPIKDPHQSINSYDSLDLAPPGFIPGGPNQYKQDPFLITLIETQNPPPAKCYVDDHWSYASNEVCLPYNSGLVLLAGYFLFEPPHILQGYKNQ